MSVASARIVPGLPSGNSTTSCTTPFHRLNPEHGNISPNNGCISEVTRTSHGNTDRRCCSLSPSLRAPGKATCCLPSDQLPSTPVTGSATTPPPNSSTASTVVWPTTASAKIIDGLLRYDLVIVDELGFAPLDDTGAQLLFRFVAAAYERRSLGIGSHWPFESWGRFLPEHTTAVSMLDRLLHHCHVIVTDGDSYRMKQARAKGGTKINNH